MLTWRANETSNRISFHNVFINQHSNDLSEHSSHLCFAFNSVEFNFVFSSGIHNKIRNMSDIDKLGVNNEVISLY